MSTAFGGAGLPDWNTPVVPYTDAVRVGDVAFYDLLMEYISNERSYRHLLASRGQEAQHIMNGIQRLLHLRTLRAFFRKPPLLRALLRLSRASNLLPSSFYIHGVEAVEPLTNLASPSTDVFRGLYRGQRVFLKRYRIFTGSWTRTERAELICREVIVWANHQHAGVLPFLGVFRRDDNPYDSGIYLVSPFMENGSLLKYLAAHRRVNRFLLIRDVFAGVQYLHSKCIVHGDLKAVNIVVKPSGRACVADLGFSRFTATPSVTWTSIQSTATLATVPWQAPELLRACHEEKRFLPTAAADVYSLGCLTYEVFTNQTPFWDVCPSTPPIGRLLRIVEEVTEKGRRPTKPGSHSEAYTVCGLTEDVWNMMEQCWSRDPRSRPSAFHLSRRSFLTSLVDARPS